MKKTLKVTSDHLRLIPFILVEESEDDNFLQIDKEKVFSVQSSVLNDLSLILGIRDRVIKGTEEDADGMAFSDEDTEYMLSLYHSIVDNIYEWETLIHQAVVNGGLKVGTYECNDVDMIWEYQYNEQ